MLPVLLSGLTGLAALGQVSAQDSDVITDDTYFYGQSPLVAPPMMASTGPWADAYAKAKALVAQMTLEEKVNLTGGVEIANGCSGNIPPIERVGFPGLCVSDSGNGLRATDFVSAWPSGLHVGASWNKDLTRQRGVGMAGEFKKKGVNVMLGPAIGALGRIVSGGRNWEAFSVDPYLAGQLVYETVEGVQGEGVITSTKHFIGNEQEKHRLQVDDVHSLSTNMDDKTMHEFYLWPFADAVRAGTGNIMCSFNRLNNSYGCQNSKALNGLLKEELGFQGFVISDWTAQHSGVASANAGLEMAMPSSDGYWGELLVEAVKNGSVSESRMDDMAMRIIAPWFQMGQDEAAEFQVPGFGMPVDLNAPHEIVDARDPSFRPILFQGAVEGHVLVKNEGALPLSKPKVMGVYGYDAKGWDISTTGAGFSAWKMGTYPVSIEEVLGGWFGADVPRSSAGLNGTMLTGGGSGAGTPWYVSTPAAALQARAIEDDTAIFWDFESEDPIVHGSTEVCIVSINAWATEGYDRPGLDDEFSDNLINNVADKCNNTVVVLHNAGVRLVDNFVDHPNVTAIIFAHLPGQDSGRALVSVLYGENNPSGKLPYTVAKVASDYGGLEEHDVGEGEFALFPQSNFDEGVFVDYRYFDVNNIEPRYEFGFGLSYTTFDFSDLRISNTSEMAEYPSGAFVEGGRADLWEVVATVTAEVHNTGSMDGKEVAQLYVSVPGAGDTEPMKMLRGFAKPIISAGDSVKVTFELTRRDLSIWDVISQEWKLQRGSYTVSIGNSSRNLPLTGSFSL